MNHRDNGNSYGLSFVSFIAGSMIGAGIALLYAPQSGERTRLEVRERAERTIIKAQKLEDDIKETIGHLIGDIRLRVNHLMEEGRYVAQEKRKEILDAIESGKRALEQERRNLRRIG